MGSENCEATRDVGMIDVIKRVTSLIKEELVFPHTMFESKKRFFEILSRDYDSNLEKRNPSNEQTFLRIADCLQVMNENLEIMGSKVSLLQHEISFLETIGDSTTEYLINLLEDNVKGATYLLEEISIMGRDVDMEIALTEAFALLKNPNSP